MAQRVYITAMAAQSGKSVVALGLMEMLSARAERVGFFRPIVRSGTGRDQQIELMRRRYGIGATPEEMYALSDDEAQAAIAAGDHDEVKKRVVAAYRQLEPRCDVLVCEGTDFAGHAPALDFDLNADLANELGAPVLAVVSGETASAAVDAAKVARESLRQKGCDFFGVIVNRVPIKVLREVTTGLAEHDWERPIYALPEQHGKGVR